MKKNDSFMHSTSHLLRRISSHLDWNEDLEKGTNKPDGRSWLNVSECIINAACAGYYQGYCHQKYGIFPGTMTGNTWAALRQFQKDDPDPYFIIFKLAAVIFWMSGNFTGLEIMRKNTSARSAFLKWVDVLFVGAVAICEEIWGTENDWINPVKPMMLLISFGSGMSTVYFRMTYGVVTNRLTGNIFRIARGWQDVVHNENKCPNWKLTVGVCISFCVGLLFYFTPYAENLGLYAPALLIIGWEVIETIYETCTDGDPQTDSEDDSMRAIENTSDVVSSPAKSVTFAPADPAEVKRMEQKQNQARLDDKVIANIKTLFDLKEQGILTEDEFTKAKAKVLYFNDLDPEQTEI